MYNTEARELDCLAGLETPGESSWRNDRAEPQKSLEHDARSRKESMQLRWIFMALGLAFLGQQSFAAEDSCQALPWINSPDIPECPAGNNTILPDTYPAYAVTVSSLQMSDPDIEAKAHDGELPSYNFVFNTLKAAEDKIPKVFLTGWSESERSRLGEWLAETCRDKPCQSRVTDWQNALVSVPEVDRFQWQQDIAQPVFDSHTGRAGIRAIQGYSNGDPGDPGYSGEALVAAIGDKAAPYCIDTNLDTIPPVSAGEVYDTGHENFGGNMEALPGGLCLHGTNQDWLGVSQYYCGDRANDVAIDVDWLRVGHVDEVVEVLPNSHAAAPCNFTVALASPKKAFELLESSQNRNKSFLDFLDGAQPDYRNMGVAQNYCYAIAQRRRDATCHPTPADESAPTNQGIRASWLIEMLSPASAFAGADPQSCRAEIDIRKACKMKPAPTNGEVAAYLREHWGVYNDLVQAKMDKNRQIIRDKLKARTGCADINFIDVPNLFRGGEPIEQKPDSLVTLDGHSRRFGDLTEAELARLPVSERYTDLPTNMGDAVLPNPTNSVLINRTVLGPRQWNTAFEDYLKNTYSQIGLNYRPVDTMDAHTRHGNLHCSTNVFRTCRPRGDQP